MKIRCFCQGVLSTLEAEEERVDKWVLPHPIG
jgi:hypothetical protein